MEAWPGHRGGQPGLAFNWWVSDQAASPLTRWPAREPGGALTYSELLPEDRLLAKGGAVPAAEAELVLALVDAHLRALPYHNDGIGPALADGTLPWGQARNLVADDVGSQSHHGRQCSVRQERTQAVRPCRWPLPHFSISSPAKFYPPGNNAPASRVIPRLGLPGLRAPHSPQNAGATLSRPLTGTQKLQVTDRTTWDPTVQQGPQLSQRGTLSSQTLALPTTWSTPAPSPTYDSQARQAGS